MSEIYRARRNPRESFVEVRGLRHRLLAWGPTEAPPRLLLHGFMDCSDTYQSLVDALPDDWHCIAPDWRGFGGSAQTGMPYWFADYLADLDALLDSLSLAEPVRLVGHSMGGNIAALYAGVRPERIRSVASLEGFGLPRTDPADAPIRQRRWLDQLRAPPAGSRYLSVSQLAEKLAHRNPRLPPAYARFVAEAWTIPSPEGGRVARFDPWHRLVTPVLYRREEIEATWRNITAPVLMLLASESEFLGGLGPDAEPGAFHSHLSRLTLQTLPGLGHMMHHEDPLKVAAALQEWYTAESTA